MVKYYPEVRYLDDIKPCAHVDCVNILLGECRGLPNNLVQAMDILDRIGRDELIMDPLEELREQIFICKEHFDITSETIPDEVSEKSQENISCANDISGQPVIPDATHINENKANQINQPNSELILGASSLNRNRRNKPPQIENQLKEQVNNLNVCPVKPENRRKKSTPEPPKLKHLFTKVGKKLICHFKCVDDSQPRQPMSQVNKQPSIVKPIIPTQENNQFGLNRTSIPDVPKKIVFQVIKPNGNQSTPQQETPNNSSVGNSVFTGSAADTMKCTICDRVYDCIERYRDHMRLFHSDVFCDRCDKAFGSKYYLKTHQKRHCKKLH